MSIDRSYRCQVTFFEGQDQAIIDELERTPSTQRHKVFYRLLKRGLAAEAADKVPFHAVRSHEHAPRTETPAHDEGAPFMQFSDLATLDHPQGTASGS